MKIKYSGKIEEFVMNRTDLNNAYVFISGKVQEVEDDDAENLLKAFPTVFTTVKAAPKKKKPAFQKDESTEDDFFD